MSSDNSYRLARKYPFFWVVLLLGTVLLGFYIFAGSMIFRYGTSRNLGIISSTLVVSFGFYIFALLVGILKPEQRITQLACLASLAVAHGLLREALGPISNFFERIELMVYSVTHDTLSAPSWHANSLPQRLELLSYFLVGFPFNFTFALGYNFYYRFPPGVAKDRFWSFLKYLLYVLGSVSTAIIMLTRLIILRDVWAAKVFFLSHDHLLQACLWFNKAFLFIASIFIFAVIVRNYRLVKEPDQRRRISWIVYGSVAGILPFIIIRLIIFVFDATGYSYFTVNSLFDNTGRTLFVTMLIVPITFGYAIIQHRTFGIDIVIRRGLKYLLARNVLQIILWLPVIGLFVTTYQNRNRTLTEIAFHNSLYFYLLVIAAISLKFRSQLREWIDRKFFREAYNQEKILLGLVEEIKMLDSMPEISKLVSDELNLALHPKSIYAFYRKEERGALTLVYSSGEFQQSIWIPEEFQLLRIMESKGEALEYPLPKRYHLPQKEKELLEQLDINLIVPMSGTDQRLIGLLLLGEKMSEEPYSANDRKLLKVIAGQIAVVYENVLLKEHVDRERKIKHEVLARFEEEKINLLKECPSCGRCFDSSVQFCDKDNSELILPLPVERNIEGKYCLDRLIGKGGMGAVYEARDLRLDRKVAIKILLSNMFGDKKSLRRFEREARASARLNHPNVISVYDYGRIGSGGAYLVMEYVDGITLRQKLGESSVLNTQMAASVFDQIFEGVKAAHLEGIIHRDLKPENIFLVKQDNGQIIVKVLDFGVAKMSAPMASTSTTTEPGLILGTLGYIAPELLTGGKVDARSDIFSLGVMVLEAVTGKRPFDGMTMAELLTSTLTTKVRLKGDSEDIRQLDSAIQKCLAKKPMERFASVEDMQRELIPALKDCRLPTQPKPLKFIAEFQRTQPSPADVGNPTDQRWNEIEKIFYSALEYEPNQRAAFLDEVCAGNEALREKVEALIEADEKAEGKRFLSSPLENINKKPDPD